MPNKVYLLRGVNEGHCDTLKKECHRKYGSTNGDQVYAILLEIFARLPIALLVDDNILCTHSGIPAPSSAGAAPISMEALIRLPNQMPAIESDSPIAFEIIARSPGESVFSESMVDVNSSNAITKESTNSDTSKYKVKSNIGKTKEKSDHVRPSSPSKSSANVPSEHDAKNSTTDSGASISITGSSEVKILEL